MRRLLHWRISGVPITAQVLALAMAATALAQAITFVVIVATPAPLLPRLSLAEVRDALLSDEKARRLTLDRRVVAAAPFPVEASAIGRSASAIARSLGAEPDTVRLRDLASRSFAPIEDGRSLIVTVRPDGRSSSRLGEDDGVAEILPAVADRMLASNFRLPAFEAAWERADGTWVHVTPATPLTSDWRFRLAISLLLGMAAVIPLAWFAARRLTRSIRGLASAARESRLGTAPAFSSIGSPEVREAAAALADMHGRVERQFADRMRLLVAIAHDLRTPLTALRLRNEDAPPQKRDRQTALIQRMERMIDEVLAYAASARSEGAKAFNLVAHVRDLLPATDAVGKPLVLLAPASLQAVLPPGKLQRAIANLVENALRYAHDIAVTISGDDRTILIVVADRGPGVPDEDLARIQEPFERMEHSRNRATGGIGLGLTITRDLVAEMRGTFTLRNRPGGGIEAQVNLPIGVRPATL